MAADLYKRLHYLPTAIDLAERKLAKLYAEADGHRMKDILENARFVDRAWDREVEIAKCEAISRGEDICEGPSTHAA